MVKLKRTNSDNKDFQNLIMELDNDLINRYDKEQYKFDAYNKIDYLDTVVLAYMENTAVGCSCFKELKKGTVEIKRTFVNPYLRGMGIATSILTELMQWAKDLEYNTAVIETGIKQPESIKLYSKHGFQIVENFEPYVGMKNSVCMSRNL